MRHQYIAAGNTRLSPFEPQVVQPAAGFHRFDSFNQFLVFNQPNEIPQRQVNVVGELYARVMQIKKKEFKK